MRPCIWKDTGLVPYIGGVTIQETHWHSPCSYKSKGECMKKFMLVLEEGFIGSQGKLAVPLELSAASVLFLISALIAY